MFPPCNSANVEHNQNIVKTDDHDQTEMKHKEFESIDSAMLRYAENLLSDSDETDTVETSVKCSAVPMSKHTILFNHGYEFVNKISNTLQGELFKARIKGNLSGNKINEKSFAIIKKTNKRLHYKGISYHEEEEDVTYCLREDALKEVAILRYLAVDNHNSVCIRKFIDFFETEKDYYLVMEYIEDNMNFNEFIEKAHEFIRDKKMKYKHYLKIIKYLFWQLFMTMHWLHNDMKCCHLNLMLEHIMIKDSDFRVLPNGAVNINPNVSIKLNGFDYAEIFKSDEQNNNCSECNKPASLHRRVQYCSPQVLKHLTYDPYKADNWALGIMLIHALIGKPLYNNVFPESIKGSAYSFLMNGKLMEYIKNNGLNKGLDETILSLVNGLLDVNELKRFQSVQILQHPWFDCYRRYKQKVEHRSRTKYTKRDVCMSNNYR